MKKLTSFCTFILFNLTCLFSYGQSPPPTVTSFTPMFGPAGTTVKIIGNSFNTTPANNVVYFGATKATVTAATSSTLTVTAPVGATYQYISVTDPTYPGTAYSTKQFLETFSCGGAIGSGSFSVKSDITSGTKPNGNGECDLDGDGKMDMVTANGTSNTISVFRNTSTIGSISFAAKVDYTTGTAPTNVAFGDFNGDGKMDIAVCNITSGTVSVFKNTCSVGTISFAAKVDFTVGTNPWMLTVNDMNADGQPDIIVGNKGAANVGILRNTSSGPTISFAAQVTFATATLPFGVAVGDLDGDGRPDVVTANEGSNSISVLRNLGGLSFAAKVDFTTGSLPVSVAIGDLDGDGYPDIASANGTAISVFKNTGNLTININTFATKVDFTVGSSPWCVAMADLDGDGKPDLAVANTSDNTVSLLKNTSTTGVIDATSFAAKVDLTAGTTPYCVALGDLDGDGKPDVAAANSASNTVSCFRNLIHVTPTMTSANSTTICSGTEVSLAFTSDISSTYTWIAANNPNTTGESTTIQTGNLLTDVITNNTVSVQTVTYTVTPTSIANGCAGTPQTITVKVNPLPVVSFSGLASNYCINASMQTLTGSPAGGTFSGAGISGNNFTPSVAGSGTHTVTYTYTNGNSCTNTASSTTQVAPLPITPSICLVTVDSLSKYNIIFWDKSSYVHGDTFLVYRDTANNNFALVGKVPFDSLSMFSDTMRTLYSANGNPNVSSWRYKIAVKDTCGNISAKSPYHQTIFYQNNGSNFNWSHYQIEGQSIPVPSLSNYLFQRDNLSTGVYATIQTLSASSTLYTDPAYTTYQNTATWRVITTWTISCTATLINPKDPAINTIALNSSRSNIYRVNNPTSVNETSLNNLISVSPNPGNGAFTIQMNNAQLSNNNYQISMYNMMGENVYSSISSSKSSTINLDVPNGIYFLQLKTNEGTAVKKIIVSK